MVSKIQGHKNPFGKAPRDYTILELDWVLEMEARDNPKQLTFVRAGETADNKAAIFAAWAGALQGAALTRFMAGKTATRSAPTASKLTPRITRGGQPVDAERNSQE